MIGWIELIDEGNCIDLNWLKLENWGKYNEDCFEDNLASKKRKTKFGSETQKFKWVNKNPHILSITSSNFILNSQKKNKK